MFSTRELDRENLAHQIRNAAAFASSLLPDAPAPIHYNILSGYVARKIAS
jgi:hypothetical protein